MIHFGLYRYTEGIKLCHIYVEAYDTEHTNRDLCGTNMECFVASADSLADVEEYKICEKCKRVYLMLELAQ